MAVMRRNGNSGTPHYLIKHFELVLVENFFCVTRSNSSFRHPCSSPSKNWEAVVFTCIRDWKDTQLMYMLHTVHVIVIFLTELGSCSHVLSNRCYGMEVIIKRRVPPAGPTTPLSSVTFSLRRQQAICMKSTGTEVARLVLHHLENVETRFKPSRWSFSSSPVRQLR